jgi:PHD/YefM family antitoxin component YafN of YafNO toxin-antitoxin module
MSVSEIRQQLHKAIDEIDNIELLQAMLVILAQSSYQLEEFQLTDKQLNILHEREEKYLKGESKTHSLDEFRTKMNKKHIIASC